MPEDRAADAVRLCGTDADKAIDAVLRLSEIALRVRPTGVNRFKRDILRNFLILFEFAVDSDVGVLVETGVSFHALFGCGSAFEDREIMFEETDTPFERLHRIVVFQGVCMALRLFDEIAVGNTGL